MVVVGMTAVLLEIFGVLSVFIVAKVMAATLLMVMTVAQTI